MWYCSMSGTARDSTDCRESDTEARNVNTKPSTLIEGDHRIACTFSPAVVAPYRAFSTKFKSDRLRNTVWGRKYSTII